MGGRRLRSCLSSVLDGVDDVVKFGEGVLHADLLHHPPHRRAVGHVVVQASRHAGMKHREPAAVAGEDEGSGVSVVGEIAGCLAVVVNDDLPRLHPELGAGVALHAGVAAQGEFCRVSVLAHHILRVAILVERVGVEDAAARKDGLDGELETGWDPPILTNALEGPEPVLELAGRVLITWTRRHCQ